ADFLACGPASVRHAHDFASRRHPESEPERMSRLYVVESMLTATGAVADHRLAVRAADVAGVAAAAAQALGIDLGAASEPSPAAHPADSAERARPALQEWAAAVARDLRRHGGASVVLV